MAVAAAVLAGVAGPGQASVDRIIVVPASPAVEARASHAGWRLAALRIYTTAGGGLDVVVRLDDHTLLGGFNVGSALLGRSVRLPVRRALLVEGADGAVVAGGAYVAHRIHGGVLERAHAPSAASFPAWLTLGPSVLQVTIFRSMRGDGLQRST